MIIEEELLWRLQQENLYSFEVDMSLDIIDKTILLKSNNLDELINFAKLNDINSVFYGYYNSSKESYLIDEEEVREDIDEDIFNLMEEDIKKHNERVEDEDFSVPILLYVFVIYQNIKIGLEFYDNWLENKDILDQEDRLEHLNNKYSENIQEKNGKKKRV